MGQKISDNAAALAHDLLKDYTIDQIREAAREHMVDPSLGKFMPRPAQIIERIHSTRRRDDFYSSDSYSNDSRSSAGPDMARYGDVIKKLEAEGKIYHHVPSRRGDSNEERIKNVVARNECIIQIRKWVPKFVPFEDKPENKEKTQEEIFDLN